MKTEKFKIYNSLNADSRPRDKETFKLPSRTIPDESMSVTEIMRRFAAGLPLEGSKTAFYDGTNESDPDSVEFTPDLAKMDMAEIQEMKENLQDTIASNKKKLSKWKQQQLPIDKPSKTSNDDQTEKKPHESKDSNDKKGNNSGN